MLKISKYNRQNAVNYALEYALKRNPKYHDYSNEGGNCANYISQCILAGAPQMNTSQNGWFYFSPANTSISWANVEPFFNFATTNLGEGFFASKSTLEACEIGDIIQLKFKNKPNFSHSLIITKINTRTPNGIIVCANTNDTLNKPLSHYLYAQMRVLHILGYRTQI
ncbi:MAG: amidase domain-containing protein [Clostridia bacterium]|nr:amidase domain-containing protein [Clostridia bacterium]